VTFASTLDGAQTLAVNTQGVTTFAKAVGGLTALTSLTTDLGGSTNLDGGAITTSGAAGQVFNDAVKLGADTSLTATDGVVSFAESVSGAGHDLSLTGTAVLGDAATDSVTAVDDLIITGATVLNANTVTTGGTQTYAGPVTSTAATAVSLTAKGIDFRQGFDRGEPGIVPPLTISAGTGGVAFGGDVGTLGRPFGAVGVDSKGPISLAAALHSSGAVTLASTGAAITGAAGNAIRTPGGTIRLDAATGIGVPAAPIGIEAASVTAATAAGGIFLRAVGEPGNLWIGAGGLTAPGVIGLDARNIIGVYAGGRIQAGGGVSSTLPVSWSVDTTSDGGPGSLRQVLLNVNEVGNANAAGLDARLMFDVPSVGSPVGTVFTLATPLPEIQAAVEFIGFGVILDGATRTSGGLVFGAAASGSTLQGVTLRNFREYAIQLRSAQNVAIDRITVSGLNLITSMGLYATGDLTGTRITGSSFTGGLRGALLDQARNLRIGSTASGQGNAFTDNKSVPGKPGFAGTGIRAQGGCTGTVVEGNTFAGNNYGFGLTAARGLVLRRNFFARNSIAAIHIDGNCTGSTQSGNVFATAPSERNKATIVRTRTARGL
jgi:hypothetical protein